jgi:predicted RNase H-like nuclease
LKNRPSGWKNSTLVKRSMLINKATGGFAPVAREASDPRRAPSIQAYSIFPRIQQIDQMLRQDKALRRRVFEVHPEVSFTVMNDKPIPEPKKVNRRVHALACGVAKNFWRDKTLLRAFWRQNHRLGRL